MDKMSGIPLLNYRYPLPLPPHESESEEEELDDCENEYESEGEESKESDQESEKSEDCIEDSFASQDSLSIEIKEKGNTPKKMLKRKRSESGEKITLPVLKECLSSLPQIQGPEEPETRERKPKKNKVELIPSFEIDFQSSDLAAQFAAEHEVPSSPKIPMEKELLLATMDSSSEEEEEEENAFMIWMKAMQETFLANKRLTFELKHQFQTLSSLSKTIANPAENAIDPTNITRSLVEANEKLELRLNEASVRIQKLEGHPSIQKASKDLRELSEREEVIERLEEKVEFLEDQLQESRVTIKFLLTKMTDLENTFSK